MKHSRILFTMALIMLSLVSTKADTNSNMPNFSRLYKALRINRKALRKLPQKIGKEAVQNINIPQVVRCRQCNGSGKISVWNQYTRQYQTMLCNRCKGKGKVIKR